MGQYDFGTIDPYVVDGVQLAGMLNQWRDALYSKQRGPTLPAFAQPGFDWINDSAGAAAWSWGLYVGATRGTLPLFDIDTNGGLVALAPNMLATTKPAADDSQAVATTAHVKDAIDAAIAAALGTLLPTGTVIDLLGIIAAAPAGWVLGINGTIGNASSGATIRANADCEALFKHLWTLNNADAPVTGGRGPSADADWIANKVIGGLDCRGVARATFDSLGGTAAGRLSNIARLGQIGGAQVHTLTATEMPSHNHAAGSLTAPAHGHGVLRGAGVPGTTTPRGTFGDGNAASVSGFTENAGPWGLTGTTGAQGGSGAHNNVQPTRTVTSIIKL